MVETGSGQGRARRWRSGLRALGCGAIAASLALVVLPGVAAARTPAKKSTGVNPAKLVWQRSEAPGAGNLNAIATDGKRFVIGGLVSTLPAGAFPIWTSTDGSVWKRAKLQGGAFPAKTLIIDIVRQGKRFLAFGEPAVGTGVGTLAWTSPDGLTWKRYKPKGFPVTATDDPNVAAATCDGVLLMVGDNTTNVYSLWQSHGDKWKSLGPVPAAGPPVATLFALTPTPGGKGEVVAGALDGRQAAVWHSKSGSAWSPATVQGVTPDNFSGIKAVVPVHGGLTALGLADGPAGSEIPYAWYSRDGSTWAADSGSLPVFIGQSTSGQGMDAGVVNGSGVLAAGHDGGKVALWSSPDGKRWARVPDQARFLVGSSATVPGIAIAHGHVVTIVRIRRFNGQSFDLVGLAIITGRPK